MEFSGAQFGEKIRPFVQGGFFALFIIALGLSLLPFHHPKFTRLWRFARLFWLLAIFYLMALWCGGAGLELMERAQNVSPGALVVALSAFSILLGCVWTLTFSWLSTEGTVNGLRVAWTLLLFSFAGWFLGDLALQRNPFFACGSAQIFPNGWLLTVAGAQLLAAAIWLRKPGQQPSSQVQHNRRLVSTTGWFLLFTFLLAAPQLGGSAPVASIFGAGATCFLLRHWKALLRFPAALKKSCYAIVALAFFLPLNLSEQNEEIWLLQFDAFADLPREWLFFVALLILFCWWGFALRFPFRLAIFERFELRAMLDGALVSALCAVVVVGPIGAFWWLLFPFAGLFFDLLRPDELDATPSPTEEPAFGEPATVSARSGQIETG